MSKAKRTLATKLKQARKDRGLSQKEMGTALKLSDKAVSAYEVGRAVPSIDTLREVSKVTYKPLSYFIDEDSEEQELEAKLHGIEQELAEIRKLLAKRQKR